MRIFTLTAHLSSNAKFSSEMVGSCLDHIKFPVEKLHSQAQVAPIILFQVFQSPNQVSAFKFKFKVIYK